MTHSPGVKQQTTCHSRKSFIFNTLSQMTQNFILFGVVDTPFRVVTTPFGVRIR